MKKLESGVLKMDNTMAYPKCYNKKCNAVFELTKETGCPFSDTCPDLVAVGFGSAKKKTNFDKIKSYSLDEFINVFAPVGCPPTTDYKESCNMNRTCQDCWRDYLTKEVK